MLMRHCAFEDSNEFCWILLFSGALCKTDPALFFRVCYVHSLVSVVSYWESFCSSYMSTSTRARAGPSNTLLMFSLARASASRSPRPHTDWSSRIAAREKNRENRRRKGEKDGGKKKRQNSKAKKKNMRRHRHFKQDCGCINIQSDESPPVTDSRMRGFTHAH